MLEFASELLQRGIKDRDQEMINTATKILGENTLAEVSPEGKNKTVKIKPVPVEKVKKAIENKVETKTLYKRVVDINQFKVPERDGDSKRNGVPVNKIKRGDNLFVDDLTMDTDIITPEAKKAPRERDPAHEVDLKCISCKKSFSVKPMHVRENFICDDCVLSKKKGRR